MRHSKNRIKFLISQLRRLRAPAFQEAQVAIAYFEAVFATQGENIKQIEPKSIKRTFKRDLEFLIDFGALEKLNVANIPTFQLATIRSPQPEEVICSLDPFSYLSHLSAMRWHGLTDRIPRTTFISRPDQKIWREFASLRLESELGELSQTYNEASLPKLRIPEFKKVGGRPVSVWSSTRLQTSFSAAHKRVGEDQLRVATIARTFLDMVREPRLCGGIYHVVEVFQEHAALYLDQILMEIDTHGTKIEQARAGYLLESNIDDLTHPTLDKWAAVVTRGGSRKLDPEADYADRCSERWALSINI